MRERELEEKNGKLSVYYVFFCIFIFEWPEVML